MAILKDLIVHGSSRFLNKVYAEELETSAFEADSAIIKKLKADEATVVGLLDVQGELHTNSWTNSNIATIDGSFYITPTIGSDSGTVDTTSTSLTFHGANYAIDSLYLNASNANMAWTTGSKVLVTGEVQVNGEYVPFGTLMGQLGSTVTASQISIIEITTNKKETSSASTYLASNILSEIGTKMGLPYRKLKISLYQRADGSTFYPIGIYMTALGPNSKTFIDIYGGGNATSTAGSSGGFADPNLRIGNLSGLGAVEGNTPQGWGIYTTNGYFKGVIVSSAGNIGGWNLTADSIWKNNQNFGNANGMYFGASGISLGSTFKVTNTGVLTATAGTIAGWNIKSTYLVSGSSTVPAANTLLLSPAGTVSSYSIAGQNKTGWMITAGTTFGVNKDGGIYATAGKIGGFDIGTSSIKNTKTSYSETTNNGVWVGTDGIGLGKGLFYVTNAGSLTAKSGSIAGWSFNASSLYKTNATPGYNASTMVISTGTASTNNIGGGGTASKTWMISAGTGFGVTTTGTLYCNDAHISGEITATQGKIGGINITNGKLDVSAINIGDLSGEIGGRNLLYNSANMPFVSNGVKGWRSSGGTASHIDISSPPMAGITGGIRCTNSGTSAARIGIAQDGLTNRFITGKKYSMGLWIRANTSFTSEVAPQPIWGATGQTTGNKNFNMTLTTNWQYVSYEGATLAGTQRDTYSAGYVYASNVPAGGYIQVCGIKLQEGEKSTTWTPAPEDVDAGITSASQTASKYITADGTNGIKVHAESNPTTNYVQIDNTGMSIYQGVSGVATKVASFKASGAKIGQSNGTNIEIAPNTIKLTAENGEEALHMDYMQAIDASNNVDYGVDLTDEHYNSSISLSPAVSTNGNFDGHLSYVATMGEFEWRYRDKTFISLDEAGFTYTSVDTGATLFNIDPTGEIWVKGPDVFDVRPVVYEQQTVTVTYAAGTVGTRGANVALGSTSKTGYTFVGAFILDHPNADKFSAVISRTDSAQRAYLSAYRATTAAVSSATVKIRMIWVNNKIIGTAE